MIGKTAVITGGNAGIGKEAAVALARLGARVLFTARDPGRGAAALAEIRARSASDAVEAIPLDLASLASVRECAAELHRRCDRVDVLINNAGLILSDRAETADGIEMTFGVNHIGHFALTARLVDLIKARPGGRIVTVSSDAHRMARSIDAVDGAARRYNAMRAYSQSKLANILFTRALAERLAGSGVTANALHPGFVRSQFSRDGDLRGLMAAVFAFFTRIAAISPERGAQTSVFLASSPAVASTSGAYFYRCRERRPSGPARDVAAAGRLWALSEELTGLTI